MWSQSIVDTLDPPPAEPTLRDKLIASTQTFCESQGLTVTSSAITAAVDQNLAHGVGPLAASETVNYGWQRPVSLVALDNERQQLNRWWRRLFRPAIEATQQLVFFGLYMGVILLLTGGFLSHPTGRSSLGSQTTGTRSTIPPGDAH